MPDLLLVTGPPASAALWGGVADRLTHHGHAVHSLDLFDPPPPDGTLEGTARRLGARLEALDQPVLIAHGSAVPAAWLAATPRRVSALVLSNGPVTRVDPFLRAIGTACAAPGLAARTWLRPSIIQRWLASSAGLRRAVVNPYVMDRDTVVAISAPWLQSTAHRTEAARYLRDLARLPLPLPPVEVPTLFLWGDADVLYPSADADQAHLHVPAADRRSIPGGKFLHPEERPWELADQVVEWLSSPRQ